MRYQILFYLFWLPVRLSVHFQRCLWLLLQLLILFHAVYANEVQKDKAKTAAASASASAASDSPNIWT